MNQLDQFTELKPSEILYSCDEFSVHKEADSKVIRLKTNNGRFLPYITKNGIVEGILLPKESDGLAKYENTSFNQLNDVISHCNSLGWDVNESNFIHLGFWRLSSILDYSECVWGLDIESCDKSSEILSDGNFVVLPISALINIGDSVAGAAALKLLLRINESN